MEQLINSFSIQNLKDFFMPKGLKPLTEEYNYILEDKNYNKFENILKIGEIEFKNAEDLLVFTCKYNGELSERASKKQQFEIAKKVLKEDFKDGAIFVFYDSKGCFRFSFIRKNYGNKEQKYSNWKRYTYFVDPTLTNKTFKNRINGCNFSSLDDIQEAFSVEKLNKKFYEEIAVAFYSLIGGKANINKKEKSFNACLQLPSIPIENRKTHQEFAVRLIGRTIFCWFLKNKKSDNGLPLIPADWLTSQKVVEINNEQHPYYHTILEKLFFLVLNKKLENRKDYELPIGHETIPFLNGGLFEAQEDDFFPKNNKGIHQINFALKIPNDWFIQFFETLEQYNFTIDENSINDFEVSIDPEMLGTIFENLLAEIDPDTEKSARKSTGSFYTPREIVDYMVEQSLLQYIKTKTENLQGFQNLVGLEEKLEELLKDDAENPFNNKQTVAILEALSEVKILDPACGSGAFPMGVLHKIITLLKKLDPGAVWWKAKQLEKIDNALVRKAMEQKLAHANSDYIRKLGVIQHSIYGVDIQPIAAEISKLRSFLSLIIDENIDDKASNRGIEPLPNLEFKFVTANTLIGLDEGKKEGMMALDFGETEDLQKDLQKIRSAYLQATPQEKEQLKQQFEQLQTQIYKNELKAGGQNKRAQQLAAWKPFSNESSEWFDPDWMFGVEKFDVVIGNPPYITYKGKEKIGITKELVNELNNRFINSSEYKINSYALFTELGVDLLTKNGVLSYIIPSTILQNEYLKKIRKYLLTKFNLYLIVSFGNKVFNAVTDSIILNVSNIQFEKNVLKVYRKNDLNFSKLDEYKEYDKIKLVEESENFVINIKSSNEDNPILDKIHKNTQPLDYYLNVYVGIVAKGIKKFLSNTNDGVNFKKYLQGKHINNYQILNNHIFINFIKEKLHSNNDEKVYLQNEKILVRKTGNRLIAVIDNEQYFTDQSIYNLYLKENKTIDLKLVTALLNSKLLNYYFNKKMITNADVFPYIKGIHLKMLPIKNPDKQNHIITIVNKILFNKKQNLDTTELENQIDLMVYKLYELSYAEVLVVDPEFGLSEEEYNSYVF